MCIPYKGAGGRVKINKAKTREDGRGFYESSWVRLEEISPLFAARFLITIHRKLSITILGPTLYYYQHLLRRALAHGIHNCLLGLVCFGSEFSEQTR